MPQLESRVPHVSELGEALQGIEETNGEAPELQPQKLST